MPGLLDLLTGGGGGVLGGQPQRPQLPEPTDNPLVAGFQNFTHARSLMGALGDLVGGLTTGQRTDPVGMYQQQANQVYSALLHAGVPEVQARLAATDPNAQKAVLAKMFPTFAPQNIGNTTGSFNPATGQFTPQYVAPEFKTVAPGDTGISYQPPLVGGPGAVGQPPISGASRAPIMGGRPAPVQTTPLEPPPGARGSTIGMPSAPAGGDRQTVLPGTAAGGTQTIVPGMSIQEKAAQEAAGQVQGKAAAALPTTLDNADRAIKAIDDLKAHPGKSYAVGRYGPIPLGLAPAIPGTEQGNFIAKLKEAQGDIFLSAYNQLRGGGAISNVEGEKGTQAMANLDRSQTIQQFDQALADLRAVISKGRDTAIKISRGETQPYPTSAPAPAPAPAANAGWTQINPNIRVRPKQ